MGGGAGGPQAAAEPRDPAGSGAVVSGKALIERVWPRWGIVRGVPGRGRIVGEELSPPASGAAIGRVRRAYEARLQEDGCDDGQRRLASVSLVL